MTSPYHKNPAPRSTWELFTWIIFEPKLLRKYDKTLSKREARLLFLKVYFFYIVPLALLLYVLGTALIAFLDLPSLYPTAYRPEFIDGWQPEADFFAKFSFLFFKNFFSLALNLAFGLAYGLAYGLGFGLAVGLAVGLAGGLSIGLILGLSIGVAVGLDFGLTVGLAFGLAGGLAVGLASTISFYLSYFRIIFYPYYFIRSWLPFSFANNFYLHDAVIWLPIWGVRAKFTQLATADPAEAVQFANFLLEYRPLQRALAMHILHAATASVWQRHPLKTDILAVPDIATDLPQFLPSETWQAQLLHLKDTLITAQQQTNLGLKKQFFADYVDELTHFREQTIRESPLWFHYYLPALDVWQQRSQDELQQFELRLKNLEPITRNVYRIGDPLRPELDQHTFLGRNDVQDQLAQKILTTLSMPLFLIQGQRRVGKSSLINFLPKLLGDKFKIIRQDLQQTNISVTRWMQDLHSTVVHELKLSTPAWQPPENWLEAWQELRTFLEQVSQQQKFKMILVLDEYEELHKLFAEHPIMADRLLGAMRSFSQHQNQVVLMLVGGAYLSELTQPDWVTHFVHTETLQVDYLEKTDALKLITDPVKLSYPAEMLEKMYQLTQGHPAILQMLCKNLVDIANTGLRKEMNLNDLEQAIEFVLDAENLAILVFWRQFCADPACKQTVWNIIRQQPPSDIKYLKKLEKYRYIIKNGERWQLRVPLFEQWIQRHGE